MVMWYVDLYSDKRNRGYTPFLRGRLWCFWVESQHVKKVKQTMMEERAKEGLIDSKMDYVSGVALCAYGSFETLQGTREKQGRSSTCWLWTCGAFGSGLRKFKRYFC
jgi:hypothetical protein